MENSPITMSSHAERRMRQRAIPSALVSLILEYGKAEYSRGDVIYHLHDKGARRKAERGLAECGQAFDIRWRNIYIVVDGDLRKVITVGWRYKRVKKNWRHRCGNRRKP